MLIYGAFCDDFINKCISVHKVSVKSDSPVLSAGLVKSQIQKKLQKLNKNPVQIQVYLPAGNSKPGILPRVFRGG